MNHYSDYIKKFDDKETIKLVNKIKDEIFNLLKNKYKLWEIFPKFISSELLSENSRVINFDNYEQNNISYINNNISYYLYDKIISLNLDKDQGLFCMNPIINRDFLPSNINYSYEYIINIGIKRLVIQNNKENILSFALDFINELNKLPTINKLESFINKIQVVDANKLFKQFPLVKLENLLKEVVLKYKNVLIFNSNGFNVKKYNFIKDNIIYGDQVATLFVYDNINNSMLEILTIYNTASKSFLEEKTLDELVINNNLKKLITKADNYSNQIGIEFYLTKYLLFCLKKFSITELLD